MSTRYLGGIIRKTPLALDPALGNAANGVFTMNQYMQAVKDGTWPGFDQYFNQTVLSLHGNGTNGDQNNTFLDSSTNNFTITRNGNTTQGTFSPFSVGAGEWSNYFDGSGDDLELSSAVSLTGDYTIEAWVYKPTSPKGMILGNTSTNNQFSINATQNVEMYNGTTYASTGTINLNTWNHVAVSRAGSTLRFFINGTLSGSHTDSGNLSFNVIGELLSGLDRYTGYLSNVRVVSGTALYTASFTVPTTPLTAVSGTQLLTCQSNRFVDNSTNAFAITRNGDVKVTPFSPFAPTAAYSAGTNGGSGYFDGSGDWLTPPNDVALDLTSGDFTVSFWIYRLNDSRKEVWFTPKGFTVYFDGGSYIWTGSTALSLGTVNINSWNHIQVVKSGSTLYSFVNGVVTNHGTRTLNNGAAPQVGAEASASPFTGYISGLRVVKGTALNTTSFTPPTEPPTAIANTSLLLNFTNAGIIDNTGKNNLETVGNAQIDTTTKKYGTGSLEFDGTGDYLVPSGDVNNFAFGSGDFTIEFWLYLNNVTGLKVVYEGRPTGGSGATPTIYMNGASLRYFANGADRITGANLSATTWYHIAVTRSGTSTKLFVDGTQSGSTYTDSTVYTNSASRPLIGVGEDLGNALNGYIDDLRITKGVARYTANFTPQTSQWQDQ